MTIEDDPMAGSQSAIRSPKWTTRSTIARLAAGLALLAAPAFAQLSPGDLSRPHADLEGLRRCGSCHRLGDREVAGKCLECHQEIAAMRAGGRGLHAADEYEDCVDCHVEHQGRDYDLVHWPGGRENFDHAETGHALAGAHVRLECHQCHAVRNMTAPGDLRATGKDLARTYLGLATACASCHDDVHQGQFASGGDVPACTRCHDESAWKPVSGFDHDRTAFVLTGRHAQVECGRCHADLPAADGAPATPHFTGLEFATCTACHADPHAGALGSDCTRCHTTGDWRQIIGEGFDHGLTGYPLAGRHRDVTCASCHGGDRRKPAHGACRDCHADAHDAGAVDRPRLAVCKDCHGVEGFRPARFGLEDHARTEFPLRGAHPAMPCFACHDPLAAAASRVAPYDRATDLTPAHDRCVDCHRDPHDTQPRADGADACLGCHTEASWRRVDFDHGTTAFPLTGRHEGGACRSCHAGADAGQLPFAGAAKTCAGCHEDVHQGVFADATTGRIDCGRCHVTTDWLAENFDHDRDSRFTLRGGHESVPCRNCHLPLVEERPSLLRYKPLPVDCRSCHAAEPATAGGRP
ncbi:MAG: hypothetical protein GY838_15885 [bacterium]|nr:hypothetical protein [bacterium]